jgi:N-methylhydantoinase A/oxoprolinase/acetone carboxylase beta subunit
MPVRLGIDVGGTFTKAAAIDTATGEVVARAVVPTSHGAPNGIAEGVVAVLRQATADVARDGHGPIVMVGHSTTLAVNSLLEGDLPRVGLVGIGRNPDLGPARKRTDLRRLKLAPGRLLEPIYRFLDATDGLTAERSQAVVDELIAAGAQTLAVSEAFAVDDPTGEQLFLQAAAVRGLPACAGHEMSGLLGLELRTVSALVNAAILPRAQATARVVAEGLTAAGLTAPLVVLRGDGGATDLHGFAALPLRSLFSGPAASVAGALHHLDLRDGIMLEVGGTSTNIALVRGRRPRLAYVRIGEYATSLRALDVWVAGVAGGSLARAKGRKLIAGLRYATFASQAELAGARALTIAPRPGDTADHLVIDAAGGRFALTVTCAANALGLVDPGEYAAGDPASARLAYEAAARFLGTTADDLARQHISLAVTELARPLLAAVKAAGADLRHLDIAGVGGGAAALVPSLGTALGRPVTLARNAEILSSIGAATSLIQAVEERSVDGAGSNAVADAIAAAEAAAIAAGASPTMIETTTEFDHPRGLIRAIATGSLPLEAGLDGAAPALTAGELTARAAEDLAIPAADVVLLGETGHYHAFGAAEATLRRRKDPRPWALLDGRGSTAHQGRVRTVLAGSGEAFGREALEAIRHAERHIGPASVAPPVVVIRGRRVIDCSPLTGTDALLDAVGAELAHGEPVIIVIEAEGGR